MKLFRYTQNVLFKALLCGACAVVPTLSVANDQYRTGPVHLMVPYPAGGPSDSVARALSGPIGDHLGMQVVVENMGGATGSIAANKVLNAKPDGKYFFQGTVNEVILPPLTNSNIRFKPTEFQSVHPVTTSHLVLLVKQDLPVKSIDDFIGLARERATTTPLTYASVGMGSIYHLISERVSKAIGAPFVHAPYRGTAPAMQDLAGGQIDFAIQSFSKNMKDMEKDGRYRIIAVLSKEKPELLQAYPTLGDHELFQGFEYTTGSTYFVKNGTPEHIIEKLNKAIAHAIQVPSVITMLEGDGRVVASPTTPAKAQEMHLAQIKAYEEIIKETGFKISN